MTIRFRAAEAEELVDDKLSAQRIYLGSTMTMENGEFLSSDFPRFPTPRSCLQPASHCFCQWTPPAVLQFFQPHPSAPILRPAVSFPCFCRLIVRSSRFLLPLQLAMPRCLKRAFSFRLLLDSYDSIGKTAAPGCRVTLGIRLLVSRARSPAYKGQLCTAHARGVILTVHRIACIAGLRGPLLTCRSRNDAPAATSAAQRLLFGL